MERLKSAARAALKHVVIEPGTQVMFQLGDKVVTAELVVKNGRFQLKLVAEGGHIAAVTADFQELTIEVQR